MKKYLGLSLVLLVTVLTACGNPVTKELEQNDTNKATAKVDQPQQSAETPKEEPKQEEVKAEEFWTYYNDAKWSEDYKGLKQEIQKVVVTDIAPRMDDPTKKDASMLGIKFKMENTTKGKFTAYPDQARLVTSTGEQIDMPDFESDHIGGEIDEGVIKEGNIMWRLERGHAADIKWIKLKWAVRVGAEDKLDGERKEYEIKIDLKK